MRWIDLLRMSSNSLKRRKLRTFLTVLGVVIGTASIVVMISLGLGLQESMYQEIEQSGGVTSLTVTGKGSSQMGGFYMGDTSNEEEATKYTTDDVIEQIKKLDHVADVQPVLSIDALLKKNGYIGYCPLTGMTEEGLKDLNIKLAPEAFRKQAVRNWIWLSEIMLLQTFQKNQQERCIGRQECFRI